MNRANTAESTHIPGDLALWFFLLAELAVFALLIIGSALVRTFHPDLFRNGMLALHPQAGVINTAALITGSYFAAQGVLQIKQNIPAAQRCFLLTAATGMIYISVKIWEYQSLLSAGYSLHSDAFFAFYYLATFFHFMHVAAGVVFMLMFYRALVRKGITAESTGHAESVAAYWHMVDLVWIVLFPALYFMRS